MKYIEVSPKDRSELERLIESGKETSIRDALLSASYYDLDWRWAQDVCLRFLNHPTPSLQWYAVVCLGHVARFRRNLDVERVVQELVALKGDASITEAVNDTLEDIRLMEMSKSVKLIECPRDAWQGLKGQIPTDLKVNYLQALISTGFKQIDAVSFVSPNAVPQMADSEDVLKELDIPGDVEIIGIVVNEKGAQRAIKTEKVRTLGFPYSISPTFLQNNQRQTLEDAIEELEKIEKIADEATLGTVVYISMAFGNPYGDPWSVDEVVDAVDLLEVQNIHTISLADTVGLAPPEKIHEVVSAVMAKYDYLEIGVHLHSRADEAAAKILAAYDAGCRRFDSALGGLGGCPFAQDALVGNIPTEKAVEALQSRGAILPPLKSFDTLIKATAEIGSRYRVSTEP